MGKIIAGITLSLDGFVNDRHGSVEPLDAHFSELHDVDFIRRPFAPAALS
jgi:hypothetical protein